MKLEKSTDVAIPFSFMVDIPSYPIPGGVAHYEVIFSKLINFEGTRLARSMAHGLLDPRPPHDGGAGQPPV